MGYMSCQLYSYTNSTCWIMARHSGMVYIYTYRIEIPERVEHTIAAGTQEIGRACSANKIGNLLGAKLGISRIR